MRNKLSSYSDAPLDERFGFLLYRTAYLLKKSLFDHRAKASRNLLPSEEQEILCWVYELGEVTPSLLVQLTFKDKTTVSRLVKSLLNKEMLETRPHPKDKRQIEIRISSAGKKVMRDFLGRAEKIQESCIGNISSDEINNVRTTLKKVFANLAQMDLEKGKYENN
jgi:DNA-binding MarR family transcriptional regulator